MDTFLKFPHIVQGDFVGFNIGNGEKLSYSQAVGLAWLCLAAVNFLSISGDEYYAVTLFKQEDQYGLIIISYDINSLIPFGIALAHLGAMAKDKE